VPVGTPVRAIANGIVTQVREDAGGFGLYITIRHPHMPDPDRPKNETVLYSNYAHLSAQLVQEGDIVEKGQEIGLSGQTGFVTGPHLHFQIDRDEAPWHPYWPFTGAEARAAGLTTTQAINAGFHQERLAQYTENPMLVVQANLRAPVNDAKQDVAKASTKRTREQILAERENRKNARIARLEQAGTHASAPVAVAPDAVVTPQAIPQDSVAIAAPVAPVATPAKNPVASFEIQAPRQFVGREWMTVRVTLLDQAGKKTSEDGLAKDIYLRTAYGEAEFNPPVLRKDDFVNGVATVEMLPRGNRTVIILLQPYAFQSDPIAPAK
jgi:murein DD-endopeptidase MepM/ murein hydrolase activator NlpD